MAPPPFLSLDHVANCLDWPDARSLEAPPGGGPAVLADLAREKIGRGLSHVAGRIAFKTAILTADPQAESTEALLAVVIAFESAVGEKVLHEAHRLAWNFSHSPTLITIEPDLVRVWTCCEAPVGPAGAVEMLKVHEIAASALIDRATALEARAARALHWLNLVSGEFFAQHAQRFERDGRADQLLLRNLRHIRELLFAEGLVDDDVCHDLLARVIFVQFLFDRRDADGRPALDAESLQALHADGTLAKRHETFADLLSDYDDSYRLFAWLNERFNGDLFPGKGHTQEARERGWARERIRVRPRHLELLAQFIRGDIDMPSGQGCLWPMYAFDVIPLEFISSIYETFVTERAAKDGIFYTPPHLVDFVLDQVLPWRGKEWNLKVLDPACGSGIFLVKAFQRLVHRWKQAHPGRLIRADVLSLLLTENLLGVDKDPHAVRVACFSLYLAMCDEIEPRRYWTEIRFPDMRGERLIHSDFFDVHNAFDDAAPNAASFDLVVGNAPWGDGVATEASNRWARANDWPVANKDIGGLFLAKGARLLKPGGRVAMIQSANAVLFNGSSRAKDFRRALFTRLRVEAVVNLSALRFKVFKRKTHTTKTSIAPACVVVLRPETPQLGDVLLYASPKSLDLQIDDFAIVFEPQQIHRVPMDVARDDPAIWTMLMWGTPRDVQLLQKLERFERLGALKAAGKIRARQGIVLGNRQRDASDLDGRRLLLAKAFPGGSRLELDASELPRARGLRIHSKDSTDFSAFQAPQLLIKQGYQAARGRLQARKVTGRGDRSVICNESFISVSGPQPLIDAACMAYNSVVGVYVMQLRSGRMAAYRPEASSQELLEVPIPPSEKLPAVAPKASNDLDAAVFKAFGLKEAERILIEDMTTVTIPDFRGGGAAIGARTTRAPDGGEGVLARYCETFFKVLRGGFGASKPLRATIFSPPFDDPAPYRLVGIQLLPHGQSEDVQVRRIAQPTLIEELRRLGDVGRGRGGPAFGARIARVYDASSGVPTIFILKPDAIRYWTRSSALNDADQAAADLVAWTSTTRGDAA